MSKMVLITSDRMGRGDDDLGRLLMRNFLYSLARNETRPAAVMLANEGVCLACEGSDSLGDLELLVEAGVPVKACGTCLEFLGKAEELRVGVVGAMPDAVEALMGDSAVLTIG